MSAAAWVRIESPLIGVESFQRGSLRALRSREPHGRHGKLQLHVSVSHPSRYPTWAELVEARYALMPPDITVAQILPPPGEYVNLHPNCFHLWEIDP